MGCGNSKVLPEASKKSYVSVVQSLVAFSKGHEDDDEPKKQKKKQKSPWFSASVDNPHLGSSSKQQIKQRQEWNKVPRYKDKFEPRVTAR